MQKKMTVISVACLSALMLALANWGMMFQINLDSVPAKVSSLTQPAEADSVPGIAAQKKDDAVSNPNDLNSKSSGTGSSSQQTPSPSAPSIPASDPEKNVSSAQTQLENVQLTGPASDVVWSISTNARVVFITVDDGWYPTNSVLTIMRAQHVPITAFLIENAAKKHPDYWREFLAAGGDIENHSLSHPDLTKESSKAIVSQIEKAENYLASFSTPTLFRPPYGAYNQTVCQAAYQAGIKHVIMWNATMDNNGLQTYNGKPLEPGSIILLHWVTDLSTQLEKLLSILNQEHLGVASLPYALEHPGKFPIAWPLAQAGE